MEEKVNAELKAITETVRRIEDHLSSLDRDLEKDRQDLQDLNIKIGQVVAEMGELRKSVNLNAERTRDKVAEAVEPVIISADKLEKTLKNGKEIWWRRILGIKEGDKNDKLA